MKIHVLWIAGVLSLAGGCSDDDSPSGTGQPPNSTGLAGPVWELARYTGPDGTLRDVLPATMFQFRLIPGSSAAGSFNQCVTQGGSYELGGDGFVSVRFDGPTDDVVCEPFDDAEFDAQSRAFRSILEGSLPGEGSRTGTPLMYDVDGDTLELSAPDGRQLEFTEVDQFDYERFGGSAEAAELLLNRTWNWDGYRSSFDAQIEPEGEGPDAYTLRFSADGSVGGSLDCNTWSGDWTGSGVSLEITRVIASEAYCGEEARATADRYLEGLRSASSLSVLTDESQLFIIAADGVRLRFSTDRQPDTE